MSKSLKSKLIKYGISFGFCILWTLIYVNGKNLFHYHLRGAAAYLVLCDGFVVPGLLLILVGALVWISTTGALDGLGYVLSTGLSFLIPGTKGKSRRYADYVERRAGRRAKGYGFLFLTGVIWFAIGMVFFVLFYSVYGQ